MGLIQSLPKGSVKEINRTFLSRTKNYTCCSIHRPYEKPPQMLDVVRGLHPSIASLPGCTPGGPTQGLCLGGTGEGVSSLSL